MPALLCAGIPPPMNEAAYAVAAGRAFLTSLDLVENINKIKSKKVKVLR